MPVCKVCKESKPIREMRMWGENVTETCQACYEEKKNSKKTEAAPPATEPAAPRAAPSKAANSPTEIVCVASLGFAAKVDGDNLVITQANHTRENDDDNITLTRSEARKLFDSFGEWIVGP